MIQDNKDGTYSLLVNGVEMVAIVWHHGVRACQWKVYGPADLETSLAIAKEFHHLVVMLGNEKQVFKAPAPQAPVTLKMEHSNDIIEEEPRSASVSRKGSRKSKSRRVQNRD
jgi:hypothetical protein